MQMIALLFISKYKQILKMPNVQPVHFQDVNPSKWTGYLVFRTNVHDYPNDGTVEFLSVTLPWTFHLKLFTN